MSAGRSAVIERVNQSGILPLRLLQHMKGFRIPLAVLFSLAAILLLFRGCGLKRNFGATALLKCGLLVGNPGQASSCHFLDLWPSSVPPLPRGVLAYRSKDYHAAIPFFELARAQQPSDPLAIFWLASSSYRSGDHAGAIFSWKELGPQKMALFFRTRSKDTLESGNVASALQQAQIAVAVDPGCGEAILQLGQVYLQHGDLLEAAGAFHKAIQMDLRAEDRGLAYHTLAEIDRSLGYDEQALGEYHRAVDFVPESYLFRRDLADQYQRLRQYLEVKALLTDLLAENPFDTSLRVRMGNLSLDQNQTAEAEWWYRSAVSADPDSGAGEAALGRLYRQKGDLDQAEAFFQKSIALNPDNHWVSASLGGVYWQQGRLDQAIAAYRWVTGQSKDRLLLEDAWTSLARLYTISGENAGAQSAWESVLEINPANPAAQHALRKNP